MAKFRKRTVVVEAVQWFENGDHPDDDCHQLVGCSSISEGKVVRYFREPYHPGDSVCQHCGALMHDHGWIDTLEGGHIVCIGDWVITGIRGEHYPCKPDIFAETYEPA